MNKNFTANIEGLASNQSYPKLDLDRDQGPGSIYHAHAGIKGDNVK